MNVLFRIVIGVIGALVWWFVLRNRNDDDNDNNVDRGSVVSDVATNNESQLTARLFK